MHNEPLTDASLETCFNSFHLFTTKLPVQNGNQLFIYQSEKWDGEYHPIQTMEFPSNTGRNAGSLFRLMVKSYDLHKIAMGHMEKDWCFMKYPIQRELLK